MLLSYQQADSGPARQTPIFADKLQLCFDVINQEGHIAIQIEIGDLKDKGIAKHSHAADAIDFAGAERTDGTRGTTREADLVIDAQMLIDLDKLRGAPDLHGLHLQERHRNYLYVLRFRAAFTYLVRGLRLYAIGGHHGLEAHRLCDEHDLHHQICGGAL